MNTTLHRSSLAALLAAGALALFGCGGGDKGDPGPQGPAGPPGSAGTPGVSNAVSVGSNSLTNTDAIAAQAARWAALQPSVTVNSVSIASPPVVTFTVVDGFGNPVLGLTNTAKASANKYATYPNLAFAIAKLVPGSNGSPSKWVNYLVTSDETSAGAVTLRTPSTESNGTLVDNQNGSYTYTFRRDITTMAATVAGLTAATGANKADLGDLTYDANATHRVAIVVSGNAPGTGTNRPDAVQLVPGVPMKKPVNLAYDFVPATGQPPAANASRVIVATAKCEACHQRLGGIPGATNNPGEAADFHGGNRNNAAYCVVCHTDQRRYNQVEAPATTANGIKTFTNTTPTASPTSPDTRIVDGRTIGNFPNYIHKIHVGPLLVNKNYVYAGVPFSETTYPQDIRNCTTCHDGGSGSPDPAKNQTPQGDNWKTVPNTLACGACHDGINFATGKGMTIADAINGATAPTNHIGGPATDAECVLCHKPTFQNIDLAHLPVTPPSPGNALLAGQSNSNTNAAWIASGSSVDRLPPGAIRVTYDIKSVSRNASKQPVMVFRMLQNGSPVALNTFATATNNPATGRPEIWDNFMGAPSVYFVFSVPQDGINAPADFNVQAYGWLRDLWSGTTPLPATSRFGGTLAAGTGADAGYYVATLNATVPDNAVMLTGGLGYTYSITSTLPLTQTNLTDYPTAVPTNPTYASTNLRTGGLIVIAPNQQKVATGYTGRRAIVEDARCNKCHQELGTFTEDAFHAGQRNDGSTCAWCHRPNQTSSGWSADSTSFIHAIHAANKRTNKFTWHAGSTSEGFWDIGFPGILNNCEGCHLPDTYAFNTTAQQSAIGATDGIDKRLYRTVGAGIYAANGASIPGFKLDNTNASLATTCVAGTATVGSATSDFSLSPWVTKSTAGAIANYGIGFTFNPGSVAIGACDPVGAFYSIPPGGASATPATTVAAAASTLVNSPTVSVCSACHDSADAISHFRINGASFYQNRGSAISGTNETCLICHGAGRIADIKVMHSTNR